MVISKGFPKSANQLKVIALMGVSAHWFLLMKDQKGSDLDLAVSLIFHIILDSSLARESAETAKDSTH